jgi:signal transduction histidine kinase
MQQSVETITVVNDLLYGLRHELGNLTAVLNFDFDALAESIPPNMERDPLLDIKLSLNDLKLLLSRLRTYPQPTTTFDSFDLNNSVLAAVEANRGYDQVPINCRVPSQPVWLDGSQTDLTRALFEVLANAREVTYACNNGLPVEIIMQTQGSMVLITVADRGTGFSQEELARNTPFLPGYTSKTRDGFMRGLGMGLFMANAVIELHHGTIQLQNRPDSGAIVIITLPLPSA